MEMKMTRRSLAVWLVIVSSILSFSVVTLAASSGKTIPFDEVNHRLETVLQELSRTAQARPLALSQLAQDRGITLVGGDSITVIIEPVSGRVSSIDKAAVAALGGVVEATSKSLMRVRVPISQLEAPLVVTSQGVTLTGASDFHDAGFYGQGVKVAIIDLGFIDLTAAQAAGELDNVLYTHDYTGGGLETYTEHGTGVAEIVADMAPQASLYLLMIGDSVDLQNATDYCITNGIDIINHSVGWYNTNYYDGTGTVAGIANNARDNGILWVNAAGNEASDGHWQGDFVDTDSDGYHEFGSGDDYLDEDGRDEGSRIYATSGDTVVIYMSWDDWAAWDQDYDLHLYDSGGTPVASSIRWQNGQSPPTEAIFYDVTSTGYYEIVIQAYDAPQKPEIEFFAYRDSGADTGLEHHIPESSIITPANSAKVLTAGAIYRVNWTTGPQESFSSQGPSNASKYAVSITKPDICGPDGVSNYTYGSFLGTSAASPHVAGAAALLLSENPSRTANDLQSLLESSAIDMGAAGKDNLYGSGRLNLAPGGGTAAVFRVDKTGNVYADGAYYGTGFYTGSADVAEWVPVSEPVEPRDVLELDPENPGHYRKSRGPCSTLVAGAAALLLSENPTRTADQLQAKLEGDAIDMGAGGKDNLYGSGRLNLEITPTNGTAAVFRVDKAGNVYADGAYYGTGFYTGSADVAEWVPVSEPVEPGDVLELDPENPGHYRKSRGPCSTLVAGVVSTKPGFVLGTNPSTLDLGPSTVDYGPWTVDSALLALIGIVPMKVTDEGGPIEPGDLLTTSSSPGYGMKWNQEDGTACGLVGKALEPLDSGTGVIQVLLMR
jgi:subtilisin family serine protease